MSSKKPSIEKVPLTVYFKTKTGREKFIAWYLDGGGEQSSNYYTKKWTQDSLYVEPPEDACPKCEHLDEAIQDFFWEFRKTRYKEFTCQNCNHVHKQANPYPIED